MLLTEVSIDEIRHADCVIAFDPDTDKSITIWGERIVALAPDFRDRPPVVIEIACRENDRGTFAKVVDVVKACHGCVSSQVMDPPRFT